MGKVYEGKLGQAVRTSFRSFSISAAYFFTAASFPLMGMSMFCTSIQVGVLQLLCPTRDTLV